VIAGAIRGALIVSGLCVLFVACGGGNSGERSTDGVIIDVDAPTLTEINSFTLRTLDGDTLVFEISPDAEQDPVEGFFPGHLRSHAIAAEQVRIFYVRSGDRRLATRLQDLGVSVTPAPVG
jgi:hypothetical protein